MIAVDQVLTVLGVNDIEHDCKESGVNGFIYIYAQGVIIADVNENAYVKFRNCLLDGFFGDDTDIEIYGLGYVPLLYVTITFVDDTVHVYIYVGVSVLQHEREDKLYSVDGNPIII